MLRFALVCFVVVCFVVALPAMADDGHGYAVGSCKPRFTSFPTISAAVSSVPAGSTILVCPGTYPEQVMISQPVTLIGIASAGQDEAAIVVPGGGLSQNVTSIFGEGVAAQVLVQTPGPVNLINLSVDGTGSDAGCAGGTWVAGIFYAPGSSGTVSRARASGQMNSGCGAGIWAENDGVSNQSVDVGESSVHDVSNVGVFMAESGNAPTFWVRVHGNTVNVPSGLIGIAVTGAGGVVSGNGVSNALFGIASVGSPAVLSSNDVRLSSAGIALEGGGPVSFNRISNTVVGILFFADGGNLQGNRIVSSSQAGVEFSCFVGSARNNVISDTQVGLDQETAGFDAFNSFDNTVSISTSCATPLAVSAVAPAAVAPTANTRQSIWQWRTPASPTAGQR
jgi:hypothetical protein